MSDEEQTQTQTKTYCVYTASSASSKLTPAIAVNDTVCIDCPSGGACRGIAGTARNQLVKDAFGNEERIQLVLQPGGCKDCPTGGKSGYEFGAISGDIY